MNLKEHSLNLTLTEEKPTEMCMYGRYIELRKCYNKFLGVILKYLLNVITSVSITYVTERMISHSNICVEHYLSGCCDT